jgi:hypothetical protein
VGEVPPYCSFYFAERDEERVCVSIECFEPGTAPLGHGCDCLQCHTLKALARHPT